MHRCLCHALTCAGGECASGTLLSDPKRVRPVKVGDAGDDPEDISVYLCVCIYTYICLFFYLTRLYIYMLVLLFKKLKSCLGAVEDDVYLCISMYVCMCGEIEMVRVTEV